MPTCTHSSNSSGSASLAPAWTINIKKSSPWKSWAGAATQAAVYLGGKQNAARCSVVRDVARQTTVRGNVKRPTGSHIRCTVTMLRRRKLRSKRNSHNALLAAPRQERMIWLNLLSAEAIMYRKFTAGWKPILDTVSNLTMAVLICIDEDSLI